mmetsp:Transcript_24541/g.67763  ORF Transcript_24541/g.67763 Transcript_24541/m.67763 type:complete len:131 (+) Transcript_24541:161-553(+)
MARNSILFKVFAALFALQSVSAFAPLQQPSTSTPTSNLVEKMSKFATTAAVVISTSPLIALAEEVDDYEYGAVSAPIGVAWLGGIVAVGTALLPLALSGGEEAFEEMKERDAGKFGTGDSSGLDRKRKRF